MILFIECVRYERSFVRLRVYMGVCVDNFMLTLSVSFTWTILCFLWPPLSAGPITLRLPMMCRQKAGLDQTVLLPTLRMCISALSTPFALLSLYCASASSSLPPKLHENKNGREHIPLLSSEQGYQMSLTYKLPATRRNYKLFQDPLEQVTMQFWMQPNF